MLTAASTHNALQGSWHPDLGHREEELGEEVVSISLGLIGVVVFASVCIAYANTPLHLIYIWLVKY